MVIFLWNFAPSLTFCFQVSEKRMSDSIYEHRVGPSHVSHVSKHPLVYRCPATGIDTISSILADYRSLCAIVANGFNARCFCGDIHHLRIRLVPNASKFYLGGKQA